MTVILAPNLVPATGDQPLNHSRVGHSRNWQTGGEITASGTASGYFEDAPDNSLTYEKWKPSDRNGWWQQQFNGLPTIDYCGIAGHTLGTTKSEITVQYEGRKRTNLLPNSENPVAWLPNLGVTMIPAMMPDAAGRMSMTGAINFSLTTASFTDVRQPLSSPINVYAVYSFETCIPEGVNADTTSIVFRLEGTNLGLSGGTDTTYRFTFATEAITKVSGTDAAAVGVEKLNDTNYRVFLAIRADTVTLARFYNYWGGAPATRAAICFGNVQVEDNLLPEPTSYIPTEPTFTSRSSTATYTDAQGIIREAAVDEARYSYAYADGDWWPTGPLLEFVGTNLCRYSEAMDNGVWSKTRCTITENAAIAPDGKRTANLMRDVPGYASQFVALQQAVTFATTSRSVVSYYVKRWKTDWIMVQLSQFGAVADQRIFFNIKDGEVGTITVPEASASIVPVGNGWFRISVYFLSDVSDGTGFINLYLVDGDGTATVTTDGNQGVYLWGAQFEQPTRALTSYIKTEAGSVTRAADVSSSATEESEWEDFARPYIPKDNSAILALGNPRAADKMRVRVRGNVAPELSVIKFGKALQLPRPFYGGHSPIDFAREVAYKNNKGITGEFLGRSKKSIALNGQYSIQHVTYEWLEEYWTDWQLAMETDAFFWAWRPDNYPFVGYLQTTGSATPEAMGIKNWYSIQLQGMGLGHE